MILQEIIDKLENFAPPVMASEGDNVGLIFGSRKKQVNKVLLALDIDLGVAQEAAEMGADLIITHHPLMFDPIRKINDDTPVGECIVKLAENGIALYSAHTNLDSAPGGINDKFAQLLGIENTKPIEITYTDKDGNSFGIGRIGNLKSEMTLLEFAAFVCEKFGIESTSFVGCGNDPVKTVALCSGSGGSFISKELAVQADVYVTGDIKYSNARNAAETGLNIVVAGHYETEIVCMQIFKEILNELPLELVFSKANTNVFNYITRT